MKDIFIYKSHIKMFIPIQHSRAIRKFIDEDPSISAYRIIASTKNYSEVFRHIHENVTIYLIIYIYTIPSLTKLKFLSDMVIKNNEDILACVPDHIKEDSLNSESMEKLSTIFSTFKHMPKINWSRVRTEDIIALDNTHDDSDDIIRASAYNCILIDNDYPFPPHWLYVT